MRRNVMRHPHVRAYMKWSKQRLIGVVVSAVVMMAVLYLYLALTGAD